MIKHPPKLVKPYQLKIMNYEKIQQMANKNASGKTEAFYIKGYEF